MNKKPFDKKKIIFKKFRIIKNISNGSFWCPFRWKYFNWRKSFQKIEDKKALKEKTLEKEAYYLYILKGFGISRVFHMDIVEDIIF